MRTEHSHSNSHGITRRIELQDGQCICKISTSKSFTELKWSSDDMLTSKTLMLAWYVQKCSNIIAKSCLTCFRRQILSEQVTNGNSIGHSLISIEDRNSRTFASSLSRLQYQDSMKRRINPTTEKFSIYTEYARINQFLFCGEWAGDALLTTRELSHWAQTPARRSHTGSFVRRRLILHWELNSCLSFMYSDVVLTVCNGRGPSSLLCAWHGYGNNLIYFKVHFWRKQ